MSVAETCVEGQKIALSCFGVFCEETGLLLFAQLQDDVRDPVLTVFVLCFETFYLCFISNDLVGHVLREGCKHGLTIASGVEDVHGYRTHSYFPVI